MVLHSGQRVWVIYWYSFSDSPTNASTHARITGARDACVPPALISIVHQTIPGPHAGAGIDEEVVQEPVAHVGVQAAKPAGRSRDATPHPHCLCMGRDASKNRGTRNSCSLLSGLQ